MEVIKVRTLSPHEYLTSSRCGFRGCLQRPFPYKNATSFCLKLKTTKTSTNHEHEKDAHRKIRTNRLINYFQLCKKFKYEKTHEWIIHRHL